MQNLNYYILITIIFFLCSSLLAQEIQVTIQGKDDGIKTSAQQDYKEAVMNAKLEAIERAGSEIQSITKIINFQLKFSSVESKAEAALLPGYEIMDIGYQNDGSYLVILSGKILVGDKREDPEQLFNRASLLYKQGKNFEAWKIFKKVSNEHQNSSKAAISYELSNEIISNMEHRLCQRYSDIGSLKNVFSQGWSINDFNAVKALYFMSQHEEKYAEVKFLLEKGVNPSAYLSGNTSGYPMIGPVVDGNAEMLRLFIKHGADINVSDPRHGSTPLHRASGWGRFNIVKILIENGANINARNNEGQTPLYRAERYGKNEDVEDYLKSKGAIK
jgi:Ankyrin repeats (3 copies)